MTPALWAAVTAIIAVTGLAASIIGSYYAAQIGVRVAQAEHKIRMDFMEREQTSMGSGLSKLATEFAAYERKWWYHEADIEELFDHTQKLRKRRLQQ